MLWHLESLQMVWMGLQMGHMFLRPDCCKDLYALDKKIIIFWSKNTSHKELYGKHSSVFRENKKSDQQMTEVSYIT